MSTAKSHKLEKPLLGIGSCLAGNAVRYNGETKKPNQYVSLLRDNFETRAFCPEMGIGLGVPRPPIHLVERAGAIRVLDVATHQHDYTDAIRDYAQQVLRQAPDLCGYILVKGSPSCGYERVKRFSDAGHSLASDQTGIFAAALAQYDPLLPLEDDGRLNDPALRASFVTRVCTYHDWKKLKSDGVTARALIDFYSRHKYLVMAHHVPGYKELGKMLSNAGTQNVEALANNVIHTLMAALSHRATRRSHANVLFHISGYLKRQIKPEQRQRLASLIEQYRLGKIPLVVPVTLLKHHFADYPDAYIEQQVFLDNYQDDLGLRNEL